MYPPPPLKLDNLYYHTLSLESHHEEGNEREFNPDFLQIQRVVETEIKIDGKTSTKTESSFVDSVPTSSPLTYEERIERSQNHLKYLFAGDDGKIKGNTYAVHSCISKGNMVPVLNRNSQVSAVFLFPGHYWKTRTNWKLI